MTLIPQELLDQIERERHRQEAKFPGQKLPATASQRLGSRYVDSLYEAGLPSGKFIAAMFDQSPDWSRALVMASARAIEAAGTGHSAHTREELIQVAAVAIRWISAIDAGECGL